jgi:monofunctional glycosyltransferase
MKVTFVKIRKFFVRLLLFFFGSTVFMVILYRFVPPPVTPLMVIRVVEQIFNPEREIRLYKDWEPLENISRHLAVAVITSEDQRFASHYGLDFEAIDKARKYNEKYKGRKTRGASTISQQTAKNVFLWPQRSWIRKGLEVYFTFLIELLWSKERIMEVYLNVIEFGDGVYGAEACAQTYFKKPASKLSRQEAALIAACIPNPLRWKPSRPTPYIKRKQQWILNRMNKIERPEYMK